MAGKTEVAIPLRNEALSGMLYQAQGAEAGVILLDGAGDALPEAAILYDELAGYLQSGGMTVLRVGYRRPRDLASCTYDVLGALDAAHTWGVERAALIVWAFADSSALEVSAEGAVADVATAAVARTTGGDSGPVRGITTIVSAAPDGSHFRRGRGNLRLVQRTPDAHPQETRPAAPLNVRVLDGQNQAIALEGEPDLRRRAAPLLSQLYLWSRQVLLGAAAPRGVKVVAQPAMLRQHRTQAAAGAYNPSLRLVFESVEALLGEDWVAVLKRLEERDPARAARVHASMCTPTPAGDLSVFLRADRAWLDLDFQARQEWMQACIVVRALITAVVGSTTRPA